MDDQQGLCVYFGINAGAQTTNVNGRGDAA